MLRLCSESSRSYPGRSVRLSRVFSRLLKRPVRPLVNQVWAHGEAAKPCERNEAASSREITARHGAIPGVIGQKSAEAIVAKRPG